MRQHSPSPALESASQREPAHTAAEQRCIRAHILARGMGFRALHPKVMADWLRKRVRAGIFQIRPEAAFVAFQDLIELDRHPGVRKALFKAMISAAINDPRPGIPAEKVFARLRARPRRYARTEPPKPRPPPKPVKQTKAGARRLAEVRGSQPDIKIVHRRRSSA